MYKDQIEVTVRALAIDKDKILLCQNKKGGYYFLPGGHVEFDESSKDALVRELKEELGLSVKVDDAVGVLENIYNEQGISHHEINIIFSVPISQSETRSQEEHIDFCWIKLADFPDSKFLPVKLLKYIKKWLDDKIIFYA